MAQQPALAVFTVDGALSAVPVEEALLRQILSRHPNLAPRYMATRMISGLKRVYARDPKLEARKHALKHAYARLDEDDLKLAVESCLEKLVQEDLRPGAIDTLIQRRKAGDRVVLVSSAPDFLVIALAARLGGADVVAAQTLVDDDGRVLREGAAPQASPQAALRRIKTLILEDAHDHARPPFVRVYGHDKADFDLLAWGDAAYAVNPPADTRDHARAAGFMVVDWSTGVGDEGVSAAQGPSAISIKNLLP